jgi:hypothetical protein
MNKQPSTLLNGRNGSHSKPLINSTAATYDRDRGIAMFLYTVMFADPQVNIERFVRQPPLESWTGKQYADCFVEQFRLSDDYVRLTDRAAVEVANACIAAIDDVRASEQAVPAPLSLPVGMQHVVNAAQNVANQGIGAPLRDHRQVVAAAVRLDLGSEFPIHLPYRSVAPLLPLDDEEMDGVEETELLDFDP